MEYRGESDISPALQDAQSSEGDTPTSSDNPARTRTQTMGHKERPGALLGLAWWLESLPEQGRASVASRSRAED